MAERFGVMLDCSRNAVMKVDKVKEFILLLKKMGYNSFMLYTEDTYEIKGEPYFGYLRGKYTVSDLKDIDSFCTENGVELIPCIQTLAHMNQALKYWFYDDVKDCRDVLLIGEEKTYELIEKMFVTLSETFSSKVVHIGMDEAVYVGLGNYLKKHGFRNRFSLLKQHLAKVTEIAEKYGYKSVMWSDMFFRLANGNEYYPEDPKFTPEAASAVPENVSLCYWDYFHTDEEYYHKMIKAHKELGKDVWFAGGAWKWVGYCPSNRMSIETMLPAVTACKKEGVENIFMTLWGDDGNECQVYSTLPSLFYISEVYKSNTDIESIKERFETVVGESWDEFMKLDLFVEGYKRAETYINGSKTMLYSDPFLSMFDVYVSGGEGEWFAKAAEEISGYKAKNGKYRLLFESMESFARLVSVKYELGNKTRKLYKSGDKTGLGKLIHEYEKTEKYLEDFVNKLEALWLDLNKPNGLETLEIRLGGLKERIKRCRARLKKYLNGSITVIEELEEDLVDEGERKLPYPYCYNDIVTVNVF